MSKWQPMTTAPKDDLILLDIGMPWAVVAVWSGHEPHWTYPSLQVNAVDGVWDDPYFETD